VRVVDQVFVLFVVLLHEIIEALHVVFQLLDLFLDVAYFLLLGADQLFRAVSCVEYVLCLVDHMLLSPFQLRNLRACLILLNL